MCVLFELCHCIVCCLDFIIAFPNTFVIKDTLSGALPVSVTTEGFSPKAGLGFRDSSAGKAYEGQRWGDRTGKSHLGQDVKLQVVLAFSGWEVDQRMKLSLPFTWCSYHAQGAIFY